jgi:hypothetical protein
MKKLLAFIFTACTSIAANAQWIEGNTIGVRADNTKTPVAIFINTYTGVGPVQKQWHRLSTTAMGIPADAKSVFLSGLLIITHGTNSEICDLNVSFKAPGDDMVSAASIGQTVEAHIGGGQRSNMATWVPIKNGEIEFYWWHTTPNGTWPDYCAYGINLNAQAYVR